MCQPMLRSGSHAGAGPVEFLWGLEATAGPGDAVEAREGHARQGEDEPTSRRVAADCTWVITQFPKRCICMILRCLRLHHT